jgi:hypothetical protein
MPPKREWNRYFSNTNKRSAQAEEEVSVVNLSKRRLKTAAAGSAQSRRDSTLGSC